MKNKTANRYILFLALIIFGSSAGRIFAQPSAAEIKKHLTGPNVISSAVHGNGVRSWDTAYSKYVWEVGFTNKVRDVNNPGLVIVVDGFLSFDIVGGRYIYWRSFTTRNSYLGISDPTAAEVSTLIKQFGVSEFLGINSRYLIGEVESIGLSNDPKFEWHTPKSLSFNIAAIYTKKGNGNSAPNEHVNEMYRVRLYRDDLKGPWKSMHSVFQRGARNPK